LYLFSFAISSLSVSKDNSDSIVLDKSTFCIGKEVTSSSIEAKNAIFCDS